MNQGVIGIAVYIYRYRYIDIGYIGRMENRMETTISHQGIYRGYIGIMENGTSYYGVRSLRSRAWASCSQTKQARAKVWTWTATTTRRHTRGYSVSGGSLSPCKVLTLNPKPFDHHHIPGTLGR